MTDDDYRDELEGWRLYYLHRGRLCSPMTGQLEPIARTQGATCRWEDHEPPADGCWCGWRLADNLDALRGAADAMCTPAGMSPVLPKIKSETTRRANNKTGVPEDVLRRWDWPAPALVKVRGFGGVRRADDVSERWDQLRVQAWRTGVHIVPEGVGMWRARSMQIVGPIILGRPGKRRQFALDWSTIGDADRHYRCQVIVSDDEFPVIFERMATGWRPEDSGLSVLR